MKTKTFPAPGEIANLRGTTVEVTHIGAFNTVHYIAECNSAKRRHPSWCYLNEWYERQGIKKKAWSPV